MPHFFYYARIMPDFYPLFFIHYASYARFLSIMLELCQILSTIQSSIIPDFQLWLIFIYSARIMVDFNLFILLC